MTFSFLKWALHSLLKACNMTCSITNQKTDKVKFGRARAAMGSCIFAHGPFPWCKSPGPKHADLPPWSPTGWQGCPSSFLLALQSCPALAVACLPHHPDKKALFPGNQANTCQGNILFWNLVAAQALAAASCGCMAACECEWASRKGRKHKTWQWWGTYCAFWPADTRILTLLLHMSLVPEGLFLLLGVIQCQNRHCDHCWARTSPELGKELYSTRITHNVFGFCFTHSTQGIKIHN